MKAPCWISPYEEVEECDLDNNQSISKSAGTMSTLTTSKKPTDLIIVCCHGIWLGPSFDEKYWLIQDFQRGETETFIEHIKIGLRQLVESNENGKDATLMFSG